MIFKILSRFFGWIIGIGSTTLLYVIGWITRKIGLSSTLLIFEVTISVAFLAFISVAVLYILDFIFKMWNLFKSLVSSFSTAPNVSGTSFGISNNTIVDSFFGFLHESGIADAFLTVGDLFIGLVSIFMVIKTYKLIIFAKKEIHNIITTLLTLMQR